MTLAKKIFLILVILLFFIYSFFYPKYNNYIIDGYAFGTTYSINIYAKDLDEQFIKTEVDSIIYLINLDMSTYIPDSNINVINKGEKGEYVISEHFKKVLGKALAYCTMSDFYDITILPLMNIWGFNSDDFIIPNQSEINKTLELVNYNFLELSDNSLIKKKNEVQIDLNSLAKGYSVDLIENLLLKNGFDNFLIEIGGELKSSGRNGKSDWVVGISNPIEDDLYASIILNDLSIATSGTYNNFFIYENIEYSHILNPMDGYPIKHSTKSVSVVAKNCIDADALATMCLLDENPYNAIRLIDKIDNVEAVILIEDSDGKIVKIQSEKFEELLLN